MTNHTQWRQTLKAGLNPRGYEPKDSKAMQKLRFKANAMNQCTLYQRPRAIKATAKQTQD